MEDFCKSLMDSPLLVCVYFAVVLLLLLLVIMQLWKVGLYASEHNETRALNVAQNSYKAALTHGADNRFGQVMSAANMSPTDGSATGSYRDMYADANNEHLVSTRGEPDFWEIGSELGAYKRSLSQEKEWSAAAQAAIQAAAQAKAAAAQAKAAAGKEGFEQSPGWVGGNFAQEAFGAPRALGENFVGGVDLESNLHGR